MAKIMLNIVAGLFIGFSFYQTPANLTGLQNKCVSLLALALVSNFDD